MTRTDIMKSEDIPVTGGEWQEETQEGKRTPRGNCIPSPSSGRDSDYSAPHITKGLSLLSQCSYQSNTNVLYLSTRKGNWCIFLFLNINLYILYFYSSLHASDPDA